MTDVELTGRLPRWAAAGVLFLLASCGATGEGDRGGPGTVFRECTVGDSQPALEESLCARVTVPLDYEPDGGAAAEAGRFGTSDHRPDSIRVFVRKFPAEGERRGAVWLLAGGPQSGAIFYPFVDRLHEAFPGLDLIIPDHRGTGFSTRICPDEEDVSSPGGAGLSGREFASCYARMRSRPEYVRAFSLTNNARDVASLVHRIGGSSGRRVLYGTSYGTQVAVRVLEATEARVDAVILDSFVPIQTYSVWGPTRRAQVADAIGHAVLARCDNDARCRQRLGGDALEEYRDALDGAEGGSDLATLFPGGDVKSFMGRLLDFPESRAWIPRLVEALASGDSAAVEEVVRASRSAYRDAVDPVRGYRGAGLSIPFANTVMNSENNLRPDLTAAELDREKESLEFADPLPYQLVAGIEAGLPRYEPGPYRSEEPDSIPPTLVLHGTLDGKTHYAGARRHVEALRGAGRIELVSVRDGPHYLLMNAPRCFVSSVRPFVASGDPEGGWCVDPGARLEFEPESSSVRGIEGGARGSEPD